ncbi:MAG: hypothetical protein U0521_07715 [Anaerolineae bacterium]
MQVQALGVPVERLGEGELVIHGGELREPAGALDLVNAGDGHPPADRDLVGQPFPSVLDGSEQLRRRPMNRIINPLRQMGAEISGVNGCAPLTVEPAALRGIHYEMPVASAQVKSAILLAALFAARRDRDHPAGPARDHTERMLTAMGVDRTPRATRSRSCRASRFRRWISPPGDASSAAFPVVAALIVPGSDITLTNINLNPTRTGLFDVLLEMGVDLTVTETGTEAGDPVGTIWARHSVLKGASVGGEVVVRMIDEFPDLHGGGVVRRRDDHRPRRAGAAGQGD